jgi:Txe/YoeB family toxin of Txe-Axe toxin-antitoxin module
MSLSERIRANSEAAPWVIEEVVKMEAEIKKLREDVSGLIKLHGRQDFEHRQEVERLEGKLEDCREALREHMGIINDERRKSVHLLMSGSQALGSSLDEIKRLRTDLETAESALDAQTDFRKEIERLKKEIHFILTERDRTFALMLGQRERLEEVLRKAKPVYATRKNTSSVRNEFEVGGYIKHYELPPHVVHAALNQTTIKQPSSNGEVK